MRMRAVQYLYNENDGSRIVRLDLGNNVLQVISRASLRLRGRGYSKVKMNTDTYLGMPAVETNVMIRYASRARKLKGNYRQTSTLHNNRQCRFEILPLRRNHPRLRQKCDVYLIVSQLYYSFPNRRDIKSRFCVTAPL